MSRFTYTIDDNFVVRLFDSERPNENGAPNILQPFDPNLPGEVPFASRSAAEAWALHVIDQHLNPPKDFSLPDTPVLESDEAVVVSEEAPAE